MSDSNEHAPDNHGESEQTSMKPKKYYGSSFVVLLICNFIYMIPLFQHYSMGGLQGSVMFFFTAVIMFVTDIVLMFILAAILRNVMKKSWSTCFFRITVGVLVIFCAVNIYRATLPLPYLQIMIDEIPDAATYFDEHKDELYERYLAKEYLFYWSHDLPAGPMVNMVFVYVEPGKEYPQKTGQISRTEYIHPLNELWYLWLYQGYAN
jgi:hypothetical protein